MSAIRRMMRQLGGTPQSKPARKPLRKRSGGDELPVRTPRRRSAISASPPEGSEVPDDDTFTEEFFGQAVMSMDTRHEVVRTGSRMAHASSLLDFCARREALALRANLAGAGQKKRKVFAGDRIIWALGRAAETHVRNQFIESRNGRGVYGKWECRCGFTSYVGLKRRTDPHCSKCELPLTTYAEAALMDQELMVVGNPDLLFLRPDNQLFRVVEIKSMNAEQFKTLTTPLPQHVMQAGVYNHLVDVNGMGADDCVTIFYVCKDYVLKPYKSFTVQVDSALRLRIADIWENAEARVEFIRGLERGDQGELPSRLSACPNPNTTRAKNCSECVGCFSNP